MNTFNLIIEDTNIINVSTNNTQSLPVYKFVGRTTTDTLYNKTLTDESNNISANNLTVDGTATQILPGGTPGDVLTLGTNSLSFITPQILVPNVVRVNVSSLVSTGGGNWQCNYGTPTDLIGNSASTFTISVRVGGGQQIATTKQIYLANVMLCIQYQSQPSTIRTIINVNVNDTSVFSCAESVPVSNNWRSSLQGLMYGIAPNVPVNASLNSNAVGTITLNNGTLFFSLF